jgi:hypothetical protein
MSHPLSIYVSCLPPSSWVVADWAVVAGPLVMGGQGSVIFLAYVSRSSISNVTLGVLTALSILALFFFSLSHFSLIWRRLASPRRLEGG